jgi:hypothetical protein
MLHGLTDRMLVFVPAGLVVVDSFLLTEPVLMTSAVVADVRPRPVVEAPPGALDLRLGTVLGSLRIRLDEPVAFTRRTGRRDATVVQADEVFVAAVRPALVAELARERLQRA